MTARDSAGVIIVENPIGPRAPMCTISTEPEVSIGTVAGAPAYELSHVVGVTRLRDDRIAVANGVSPEIRIYDGAGRFLRAFGSEGDGPGEVRFLSGGIWSLPGDTLWVGSPRPWRWLVFGPDGEWSRTVRPDLEHPGRAPGDAVVLRDGRSVLVAKSSIGFDATFDEPREAKVLVFGAEGNPLQRLGTWPGGRWGTLVPLHPLHERDRLAMFRYLESFLHLAGGGDRLVVAHGDEPELLVFSGRPALTLRRIVRFEVPDRAATPADVELAERRTAERLSGVDWSEVEIPAADRVPALTRLRMGRDGRVWVREYPRNDAPERSWLAFDREGRLVCRLTLPPFAEVFEFGSDYLLVLDRGELDVERVLSFALSSPDPADARVGGELRRESGNRDPEERGTRVPTVRDP